MSKLIDHLSAKPSNAALCIVGEPTDMQPVIGHKGGRSYRVRVEGRGAHSSLAPRAVNAIDYAAEMIMSLRGSPSRCSLKRSTPSTTCRFDLVDGNDQRRFGNQYCSPRVRIRFLEYRCLAGIILIP